MSAATAAVTLAFVLDAAVEEFPDAVHPVALFGRVVAGVDRPWPVPRLAGVIPALVLPLSAAVVAAGATAAAVRFAPTAGVVVAGLALFATTSLRMLLRVTRQVVDESDADLAAARESVRALVGRDASSLSPGHIRSAAVESAAENLADGLVAPLAAFVVGAEASLAAAVGAAVWVKAVNTLDSMLGYRDRPLGWASARLDDIVMWIPARVSALLLAVAAASPRSLLAARRLADEPPSPNSGWPMATLAAALSVRLEKPGEYTLEAGAELPTSAEARRGVRTVGVAGALSVALAGVATWV